MNHATSFGHSCHADEVVRAIKERLARNLSDSSGRNEPIGSAEHTQAAQAPRDQHPLAITFAQLFWSKSPEEELSGRSVSDDVGVTIENWRLFSRTPDGVPRVLVSNPSHARDGWDSTHTMLRVISPDMPFVVDSLLMVLTQCGITAHYFNNVVYTTTRGPQGDLVALSREPASAARELFIHVEIDRLPDSEVAGLAELVEHSLRDVKACVTDFPAMRGRLSDWINHLQSLPVSPQQIEAVEFLHWLGDNHFTFLGYREFLYVEDTIVQVPESTLGVLRLRRPASERRLSQQPEQTQAFLLEPALLSFSKSGTLSRVHRPAYPDYVGLRLIDASGRVTGEWGFLGLYTSRVYLEHPISIPTVRSKLQRIVARSALDPNGFDGKVLAQVLATYPRDELLQISEDELFRQAIAITHIHERRQTRVFTRSDRYGLFVTCLVFLPRDVYNTSIRERVQSLLVNAFGATHAEYQPYFSESILVRLHFTLRVQPGKQRSVETREIEQQIIAMTHDWIAELSGHAESAFGESQGRLLVRKYAAGFAAGYRETYTPRSAVDDIVRFEQITESTPLVTHLYRRPEDESTAFHIKLYHAHHALPLSDVIPALENMGLRVDTETSQIINRAGSKPIHLQDFVVHYHAPVDLAVSSEPFARAMTGIWFRDAENDRFNQLMLAATLTVDWIAVLRAYARYNKQLRFGFSQDFTADTLGKHPQAARLLCQIFAARFDPDYNLESGDVLESRFIRYADGVEVLNEDRALRRMLELMLATDRTNFWQTDRRVIALKLAPNRISHVPSPIPAHEIFISAPHVEGLHLRGGPIARGGLRWSDRHEDYRTEVLGLVKAQTVKNAVIVPTGAKGGFVVRDPDPVDRQSEGRRCYADFVGGLLDVTDNIVNGMIRHPDRTRCHDGEDAYLVVAADKGTASFSDLANSLSMARSFWLGDAFASGGSNGYDHKQMGITARGAWISVRRHFAELGIDVQTERVTVLGIGDMAGDVFGNGMLLSNAIALVAAFNHQHIFIDPDPDPLLAYQERSRLFGLDRSTWAGYNAALISEGGGVYRRDAKRITITPRMRSRFALEADSLSPDELIHELLKAPIDLLWNGGIGTYIKAAHESHEQVGDRANDGVRVDATELRCQVIGEGGNLGVTQAGRIVFAGQGGRLNTDFMDNSAGVDCSDHEVNIKILLNELVANGELTLKHRNRILQDMTGEVADLVLKNNDQQTLTISLALLHSVGREDEYRRFIIALERDLGLNRSLEGLPSDGQLQERARLGQSLTRPELAVLVAYAKMHIKRELVQGHFASDPATRALLHSCFPASLTDQFGRELTRHRLRTQIIATQAANVIVHHLGITSLMHLREMVGGTVDEVARAFLAAYCCLDLAAHWLEIERESTTAQVKSEMRLELIQVARHATRWLLRNRRAAASIDSLAAEFAPVLAAINDRRLSLLGLSRAAQARARIESWQAAGVRCELATRTAEASAWVTAFAIGDAAATGQLDISVVADHHATLGDALALDSLAEKLLAIEPETHWQSMERDILVEDVTAAQSRLAASMAASGLSPFDWLQDHDSLLLNWQAIVQDLTQSQGGEFAMLTMTCRKLNDLWRGV